LRGQRGVSSLLAVMAWRQEKKDSVADVTVVTAAGPAAEQPPPQAHNTKGNMCATQHSIL